VDCLDVDDDVKISCLDVYDNPTHVEMFVLNVV
jgi:hypothetical protein